MIFAVDPGTDESGFVALDNGIVVDCGIVSNDKIRDYIDLYHNADFAIEMIASYGMPVGKETFETCVWIGKFEEYARIFYNKKITRIFRRWCKITLCDSPRAKDSNIRQALIDLLGEIGVKKNPGPLYKIRGAGGKHIWAALAVAVTYQQKKGCKTND